MKIRMKPLPVQLDAICRQYLDRTSRKEGLSLSATVRLLILEAIAKEANPTHLVDRSEIRKTAKFGYRSDSG